MLFVLVAFPFPHFVQWRLLWVAVWEGVVPWGGSSVGSVLLFGHWHLSCSKVSVFPLVASVPCVPGGGSGGGRLCGCSCSRESLPWGCVVPCFLCRKLVIVLCTSVLSSVVVLLLLVFPLCVCFPSVFPFVNVDLPFDSSLVTPLPRLCIGDACRGWSTGTHSSSLLSPLCSVLPEAG